jgi:hypothetical protein
MWGFCASGRELSRSSLDSPVLAISSCDEVLHRIRRVHAVEKPTKRVSDTLRVVGTLEPLFLARRVLGLHPAAFLIFQLLTTIVAVVVLILVARARGRSELWAVFGIFGTPGLLIGLLILIALPVQTKTS